MTATGIPNPSLGDLRDEWFLNPTTTANPNGIASYSPGLPYSATLGLGIRGRSQPQRGCAFRYPRMMKN